MSLLEARDLTGGYGGMDILKGLSMTIEAGAVTVIIGANGAGKSTAMKALFGLVRLNQGSVHFDGADITGAEPETLVRRGMAYVPQERNVFPNLTVEENLEMGAYTINGDLRPRLARVYDLFAILKEKRRQPAGELSGGQRQMVAVGRAMMMDPKLLMLDEPTAGLSPRVMDEMFDSVLAINDLGVGILMVEQNARQALAVADKGYVLASGSVRFEDSGAALLANPEVSESFLGG
ncbi:MAG: ABC transporter ATP-binding protein [Azospirillaceae bacterium]